MRRLCAAWSALILAGPALAQDRTQTLADIRQELSVLYVELQRLGQELNTTGGAGGTGASGPCCNAWTRWRRRSGASPR
jgi:hypothetical protein